MPTTPKNIRFNPDIDQEQNPDQKINHNIVMNAVLNLLQKSESSLFFSVGELINYRENDQDYLISFDYPLNVINTTKLRDKLTIKTFDILHERLIKTEPVVFGQKFFPVLMENKKEYFLLNNTLLRHKRRVSDKVKDSEYRYNALIPQKVNTDGQSTTSIMIVNTLIPKTENGQSHYDQETRIAKFQTFRDKEVFKLIRVDFADSLPNKVTTDMKDFNRLTMVSESSKSAGVKKPEIIASAFAYAIQRFYDGNNLGYFLKDRNRYGFDDLSFLIRTMIAMTRAVNEYHEEGFIHRDIKPINFMMSTDGSVHLIDYDFSKKETTDDSNEHLGSALYLAPETTTDDTTTRKTDIYCLGITFAELLGAKPRNKALLEINLSNIYTEVLKKPDLRALGYAIPELQDRPTIKSRFVQLIQNMTTKEDLQKNQLERSRDERLSGDDVLDELLSIESALENLRKLQPIKQPDEQPGIASPILDTLSEFSYINNAISTYTEKRKEHLGFFSRHFDLTRGLNRAFNYKHLLEKAPSNEVRAMILFSLFIDKKSGLYLQRCMLEEMKTKIPSIQNKEDALNHLRTFLPANFNEQTALTDLLITINKQVSKDDILTDIEQNRDIKDIEDCIRPKSP